MIWVSVVLRNKTNFLVLVLVKNISFTLKVLNVLIMGDMNIMVLEITT